MATDRSPRKVENPDSQIGIYVHIPFCEKKCFYCDFYSIENHSQREEFIDSISREIRHFSETHNPLAADTVFFGGGTPSLLKPADLEKILAALHDAFRISSDAEFTMECNPGTIDTAYLSDYKTLGANRLSFGVQSFFEDELRFLERIHGPAEAFRAVEVAREAGFDNINIDLIYALPGQPIDRLTTNLEKAVSLETDHISAYSLIVEPGTPLAGAVAEGRIVPATESVESSMYEIVMDFMAEHGYSHYEISNYAQGGFECRHNLKYWNAEQYAGFGPSAHSYVDGTRWWNVSSLAKYIARLKTDEAPVSAREKLTPSQMLDEFVLLHLRQGKLDTDILREAFGLTIDRDMISGLETAEYCVFKDGVISLTKKGFKVSDGIAETILAKHSPAV